MKQEYRIIIVLLIFVSVFSVYSIIKKDDNLDETIKPLEKRAEIAAPINDVVYDDINKNEEESLENSNKTTSENDIISNLKSFNPSELEKESDDIQTGLDFLENPL